MDLIEASVLRICAGCLVTAVLNTDAVLVIHYLAAFVVYLIYIRV